jgi:hypothetical protein
MERFSNMRRECDVGGLRASKQRPDALDGIEVRCVGELDDREPVVVSGVLSDPGGPVDVEVVIKMMGPPSWRCARTMRSR